MICTAGSHVICIKESYGPVQHLLDEFLSPKYDVAVTYVDGRTVKEFIFKNIYVEIIFYRIKYMK